MDEFEQAFHLLPDTVIITDAYWYILDYNHAFPFEKLKKGQSLCRYMPDCRELPNGPYLCGDRTFRRRFSKVTEDGECVGYVAYLVDVTERERLVELRRQKSGELAALTQKQAQANAELEAYVREAEMLTDTQEQLRIARVIHDDVGHAITALNTISQMCLQLRQSDPVKYRDLLEEGIAICRRAEKKREMTAEGSLRERLEAMRDNSPFPIELTIAGEEPDFIAPHREVILDVCREAYHNALAHSLADQLTIEVRMAAHMLSLRISDNGRFHGTLTKGFGLMTMEENVRATGGSISFEATEGRGFGILAEWRKEP